MFRTKQTRTEAMRESVGDLGATARERMEAARVAAAPRVQDLADRAKPKVEAAQATLLDTVLPKVGAAIGAAATALSEGAEQAREAAAPHLEQARATARESASLGGDRARDALLVLRGEAVAKPVRRGRGKWLIGIGLVAAGLAAVAAFRKQQQANDPWATPDPSATQVANMGGTYGAPGAHEAPGSSLKDKAAEKMGQAKDAVSDTAAKVKDKASDLAAKGQSAVTDAKDRSGESAASGEVTAVPVAPDSDAITSDAVDHETVIPPGEPKSEAKGLR